MSKRDLSPDSLEAQADALLAAADSMDIPDEIPMPGKSSRSGKAAKAARPEADHIMTDEEAKKAGIVRLDDKQVAALPAATRCRRQGPGAKNRHDEAPPTMAHGTPASAAHDAWEWQTATTDTTGRTRRISLATSALRSGATASAKPSAGTGRTHATPPPTACGKAWPTAMPPKA
jgi:hypothetical protein